MALASAVDILSILANLSKVYLRSGEYQPTSFGEFYRKTGHSTMLGSIENRSSRTFRVKRYNPHFGRWTTKLPTGKIKVPDPRPHKPRNINTHYNILFDILNNLNDRNKKVLANAGLFDASPIEQAAWIANELSEYGNYYPTSRALRDSSMLIGCRGVWSGTEVAVRLEDYHEPARKIVLMIRRRPRGNAGAGISMSWGDWLDNSGKGIKSGESCEAIADHIMEHDTVRCKFSEQTGWTKHYDKVNGHTKKYYRVVAPTVTARSNRLRVSVRAGKMPRFIIEEDR